MESDLALKYQELLNGETYAYRKAGHNSSILVLIHGQMSSSKFMEPLLSKLCSNYQVFALDMRGYGHSTYNKPISTHDDFADDLKLFLDALKIKKVSILGWSSGGGTAITFASKFPENVEKIILMCSMGPKGNPIYPSNLHSSQIEPYKSKKELMMDVELNLYISAIKRKDSDFIKKLFDQSLFSRKKPDEVLHKLYIEEVFLQRNFGDVTYANHVFNMTNKHNGVKKGEDRLKNVKAKILLCFGEKDETIKSTNGDDWFEGIGLHSISSKTFWNCGHFPIIDALDTLVSTIISFLT